MFLSVKIGNLSFLFKRRSSAPSQVAKRSLNDKDGSPLSKRSPLALQTRNIQLQSPTPRNSIKDPLSQTELASQISQHVYELICMDRYNLHFLFFSIMLI